MKNTQQVPKKFQAFVPSIDTTKLNTKKDAFFIIEHFLHNATLEAWQWMMQTFHENTIKNVIKQSKILHPRDIKIWQILFNIPNNQIACLQTKSQNIQKNY